VLIAQQERLKFAAGRSYTIEHAAGSRPQPPRQPRVHFPVPEQ
jgi:hypothetical protein